MATSDTSDMDTSNMEAGLSADYLEVDVSNDNMLVYVPIVHDFLINSHVYICNLCVVLLWFFLAPPAERQRSFSKAELSVVCLSVSLSVNF